MAFGSFAKTGESSPMAEINMIPLIDVMLVLLVIFIVTAPLLTHSVKIDLPRASNVPNITKPEHVDLAIDAGGGTYWNGERVDRAGLSARFELAAKRTPQPELHIRADRVTQYQNVAEVMAGAARAGLARIGFVSDPNSAK
jgi:biopolymer transport protein ExbD